MKKYFHSSAEIRIGEVFNDEYTLYENGNEVACVAFNFGSRFIYTIEHTTGPTWRLVSRADAPKPPGEFYFISNKRLSKMATDGPVYATQLQEAGLEFGLVISHTHNRYRDLEEAKKVARPDQFIYGVELKGRRFQLRIPHTDYEKPRYLITCDKTDTPYWFYVQEHFLWCKEKVHFDRVTVWDNLDDAMAVCLAFNDRAENLKSPRYVVKTTEFKTFEYMEEFTPKDQRWYMVSDVRKPNGWVFSSTCFAKTEREALTENKGSFMHRIEFDGQRFFVAASWELLRRDSFGLTQYDHQLLSYKERTAETISFDPSNSNHSLGRLTGTGMTARIAGLVDKAINQFNKSNLETMQFNVRFTANPGNAIQIDSEVGSVAAIQTWEQQTRNFYSSESVIRIGGICEDISIPLAYNQVKELPAFENESTVTVNVRSGALNHFTFPVAHSEKLQLMPDKKAVFEAWVKDGCPLLWEPKAVE